MFLRTISCALRAKTLSCLYICAISQSVVCAMDIYTTEKKTHTHLLNNIKSEKNLNPNPLSGIVKYNPILMMTANALYNEDRQTFFHFRIVSKKCYQACNLVKIPDPLALKKTIRFRDYIFRFYAEKFTMPQLLKTLDTLSPMRDWHPFYDFRIKNLEQFSLNQFEMREPLTPSLFNQFNQFVEKHQLKFDDRQRFIELRDLEKKIQKKENWHSFKYYSPFFVKIALDVGAMLFFYTTKWPEELDHISTLHSDKYPQYDSYFQVPINNIYAIRRTESFQRDRTATHYHPYTNSSFCGELDQMGAPSCAIAQTFFRYIAGTSKLIRHRIPHRINYQVSQSLGLSFLQMIFLKIRLLAFEKNLPLLSHKQWVSRKTSDIPLERQVTDFTKSLRRGVLPYVWEVCTLAKDLLAYKSANNNILTFDCTPDFETFLNTAYAYTYCPHALWNGLSQALSEIKPDTYVIPPYPKSHRLYLMLQKDGIIPTVLTVIYAGIFSVSTLIERTRNKVKSVSWGPLQRYEAGVTEIFPPCPLHINQQVMTHGHFNSSAIIFHGGKNDSFTMREQIPFACDGYFLRHFWPPLLNDSLYFQQAQEIKTAPFDWAQSIFFAYTTLSLSILFLYSIFYILIFS